eukprot:Gregarina_sp_Poly_1__3386@NODE_1979_length_2941_cov_243_874391_g1275_i0_p2_GENE_NODE_1979_length_2941_cov_243_874391_g1275_i0NODE_1979_length_2941_cov_243_874391_g1275_i0_p2_ORF_typecomplete_len112_score15_77_NODE_1979_length_2941_cov_243_874391_g1275_i022992634
MFNVSSAYSDIVEPEIACVSAAFCMASSSFMEMSRRLFDSEEVDRFALVFALKRLKDSCSDNTKSEDSTSLASSANEISTGISIFRWSSEIRLNVRARLSTVSSGALQGNS